MQKKAEHAGICIFILQTEKDNENKTALLCAIRQKDGGVPGGFVSEAKRNDFSVPDFLAGLRSMCVISGGKTISWLRICWKVKNVVRRSVFGENFVGTLHFSLLLIIIRDRMGLSMQGGKNHDQSGRQTNGNHHCALL